MGAASAGSFNTGTFARRHHENFTSAELAQDLVRDRAVFDWNLNHAFSGFLASFTNGIRNFLGFTKSVTNFTVFITNDDQSGE